MVVNRVGPLSLAKISGVLYAILGLVFGAFISGISMMGLFGGDDADGGGPMAMMFGAAAIVLLPLFYGCLSFVMTLIMAALYNLVAGWVGGVELDIT